MIIVVMVLTILILPQVVSKLFYKSDKSKKTKEYIINNNLKIKRASNVVMILGVLCMAIDIFLFENKIFTYFFLIIVGISLTIDKFTQLVIEKEDLKVY